MSPNLEIFLKEELRGFEMKFDRNEVANSNEKYYNAVDKMQAVIMKCTTSAQHP